MYLSKYQIDIYSPVGRQLLSSTNWQAIHETVMGKLFGGPARKQRILFRITDQDLYIQSDTPPERLPDGLTHLYTRDREPSFAKLKAGDVVRFNLLAMPIKSVAQARHIDGQKPRGKRVYLAMPEERINWLYQKGEKCGFTLLSCTENRRTSYSFNRLERKGGKFRLPFTEFAGKMQVTDVNAFRKAIHEGIGPERAFGCGLLFILFRVPN